MKYVYNIFSLMILFALGCQTMRQTPIELINRYYQEGKFNGSILIAQNDQIVVDTAFGYRDFGNKTVFSKETPVYIASLSKPVTAIAISLLVQKGNLSFDDIAAKFVKDLPAYAQNITIKQLLNHTSGVKDYENIFTKKGLTNSDVIRWLNSLEGLEFKSGTKFQYSNSGYIILAQIIENVSKMSYAQFLKKSIFDPCQMHHTTVCESNTIIPNRAIGHDRNKRVNDYSILTTGDGGIYSTSEDLFKLDKALRSNQLLSEKSTGILYQTPILQDGTKSKYGLGWYVEKSDGVTTVMHTGGLAGFRSLFRRDLKNGNTIIALTNQGDAFPIFNFLDDVKKIFK